MGDGFGLALPGMRLPDFKMPRIASASENFHGAIIEKIRRSESALSEEQALSVTCYTRIGEPIVVARLQFTGGAVILVHGWDSEGQPTYVMSSVYSLELVCKVTKRWQTRGRKIRLALIFHAKGRAKCNHRSSDAIKLTVSSYCFLDRVDHLV